MSANPEVLLVVGDLVEDIIVWPHTKIEPGTDTASTIHRRRGGSAANVAAFAAGLGVPTRFICSVSDDAAANALIHDLKSVGVEVKAQFIPGKRTATIVILIDQAGERTMFPDRVVCTALHDVGDDWIAGANWLHVPAYSLFGEPLADTVTTIVDRARAQGARMSADASSAAALTELGVDWYLSWLRAARVDVLFANADEAKLLGIGQAEITGVELVVVKQGPNPVLVFSKHSLTPREFTVPHVDDVLDTTGAGDAFAAGFLSAWRRNRSINGAVAVGITTAQKVLRLPGAQSHR